MSKNTEQPKKSVKFRLGVILICVSVMFVLAAFAQMYRNEYADFPCDYYAGYSPNNPNEPAAALTYCIDYMGRHVVSGAGIYAQGSSKQNTLTVDSTREEGFNKIVLEREGETLIINGEKFAPGQYYSTLRWFPSFNPWLLYANFLTVLNRGVDNQSGSLVVTGEVNENWLPNPVGLIILFAGLKLITSDHKKVAEVS